MNQQVRPSGPVPFLLPLAAPVLGLLFVFDAGSPRSIAAGRSMIPREFVMQLLFLPVAIGASVVCAGTRPEKLKKIAKILWWVSFASLLLVYFPVIGKTMNGASRWVGFGSFTIQPAEFVKVTCILYLAAVFLDRKPWNNKIKYRNRIEWADRVMTPKLIRMMPAFAVLFAVLLIEKEPDMGTGAVVAFVAFCMLFLGGVSKKSLIAATCLAALGVFAMVKQEPYRLERITNHAHRSDSGTLDDT